jgi:hypothetical protein
MAKSEGSPASHRQANRNRYQGIGICTGNLASKDSLMNRKALIKFVLGILACFFELTSTCPAQTQAPQEPQAQYSQMAPLDQYLIANQDDEVALAKSAAPDSISSAAEVMVLGPKGYSSAVKGQNGFVCIVERSWTSPFDAPEFWNPKSRSPICYNAPAARSYLPITILKTNLALAGRSKDQIHDAITAAVDKKELPALEPGAMCYMLSKQGRLNDRAGHWYPHLMFFSPLTDASLWGANLDGSPLLGVEDKDDRLIILMIPVGRWSDGTEAPTF